MFQVVKQNETKQKTPAFYKAIRKSTTLSTYVVEL